MLTWRGTLLLAAGVCPLWGCFTPTASAPGVLIVVIDSLRADRLHHAGDPRLLSPRLDALAAESTRFTRARTSAPWTTPSVMTLFTGLSPEAHGVDRGNRALHPSVPTLAERLKRHGWTTGAVMPALTLSPEFGFGRGFDEYHHEDLGHLQVTAPWSLERAGDFLERNRARPFFLYVHLWDVHYDYNPPPPHDALFRRGRAAGPGETDSILELIGAPEPRPLPPERLAWLEGRYAAEIRHTDETVGKLLDKLDAVGRGDDTIVVVTSDHGEAFQEHGILGHTVQLYEELMQVPLLVRWPGQVSAGQVASRPAGLIDLSPTILELLGLDYGPGTFEGRSLAATLRGESGEESGAPPAYAMSTSREAHIRGLWTPRFSYFVDLATRREELYDLDADPAQRRNIAPDRPQLAAEWRRRLCRQLMLQTATTSALEERLRGLGYLDARGPNYLERIVLGCSPEAS